MVKKSEALMMQAIMDTQHEGQQRRLELTRAQTLARPLPSAKTCLVSIQTFYVERYARTSALRAMPSSLKTLARTYGPITGTRKI
jgi:hypothetical protein